MTRPFVSVIIPVMNTPIDFVSDCLSSIEKQSYGAERIEIVLCEECSTPEYSETLENAVDHEKMTIRICHCAAGAGLAVARNNAISKSNGEWVLVLDSDDLIETDAIEALVHGITDNTVMVYGDSVKVANDLANIHYVRRKAEYHRLLKEHFAKPLNNPLYSSVFIAPGELIKKDALVSVGGYAKPIGEKPPLWINLFEMVGPKGFGHIQKVVYKYRDNPFGITALRERELLQTHQETFLMALRRLGFRISKVMYEGRFEPGRVKHFSCYDDEGELIRIPYLDYTRRRLALPD